MAYRVACTRLKRKETQTERKKDGYLKKDGRKKQREREMEIEREMKKKKKKERKKEWEVMGWINKKGLTFDDFKGAVPLFTP